MVTVLVLRGCQEENGQDLGEWVDEVINSFEEGGDTSALRPIWASPISGASLHPPGGALSTPVPLSAATVCVPPFESAHSLADIEVDIEFGPSLVHKQDQAPTGNTATFPQFGTGAGSGLVSCLSVSSPEDAAGAEDVYNLAARALGNDDGEEATGENGYLVFGFEDSSTEDAYQALSPAYHACGVPWSPCDDIHSSISPSVDLHAPPACIDRPFPLLARRSRIWGPSTPVACSSPCFPL